MRLRTLTLSSLLGLSLVGCRSDSNVKVTDGNNTGGDSGSNAALTVKDVQNAAMPVGTAVALHGVIVTAIDTYGTKTGDIWVEDAGGGAFSGIHVFGAPTSQVASLTVGDVVDITNAEKSEFAISSDTSGLSETELVGAAGGMMSVTKTGSGAVPAAMVVDALAIGQMSDPVMRNAEWEKWEGVLITLNNVSALSSPKCITSQGMCPDATRTSFNITGGAQLESTLADYGMVTPSGGAARAIKAGDCIGGVTGVLGYAFNYQLQNTGPVTGLGTACPAPESVCGDGIDNDGNTFTDCNDNACIVSASVCRTPSDITMVQAMTPTGAVEIDNVYVSAIAHNGRSFWVSTKATATPNEGLYVFNNQTLDPAIAIGTKVSLIGKVSEFNDDMMGGTLTELAPLQIMPVTGAAVPMVPVTNKTVAQLLDAATAPQYESVLVTLTNVKFTALGSTANGFVATAEQTVGTTKTTFSVGTDIAQLTAANLVCNATVTGLWTNLEAASNNATTKPNAFGFIPLDTSVGTVATGTCL